MGQLLIVGLSLGGDYLLRLFPQIALLPDNVSPRIIVFLGMTAGMVLTVSLILFLFFLSALFTVVLWKFQKGWKRRTLKRAVLAGVMISMTTAILSGTALLLIPQENWRDLPEVSQDLIDRMLPPEE